MVLKIYSVTIPLLVLLATSIFGWIVVPWFIKWQVSQKFVLSPEYNAELYSAWTEPPIPIFFKVYLFNVTNPLDVERGELPLFNEVGPYVFQEKRKKIDLVTDDDEDTITYKEHMTYHFQSELTKNLSLEDRLTIINVPFVAAAMKISHDIPWPMNELAKAILLKKDNLEPLFVEKSVRELLFNGWNVPFLQKIHDELGFSLLPDNKFAYFMNENDTAKGPLTVSRGLKDRSSFGQVLSYQNKTEMKVWKAFSECNRIRGTDGSLFNPFIQKDTVLHLFVPPVCVSMYATFERDTNVEGIHGYRFTTPPEMMADPRKREESRCYCVHIDDEPDKCLKEGALDLGSCREGAPVAGSPPHFLDGNADYITRSGLSPNRTKHGAFFEIEPGAFNLLQVTGIILQGRNTLQINLILKPVKGIASLKKVPEMLFPLFWFDEGAKLNEVILTKIKSVLFLLRLSEFLAKWVVPGVALLAFLVVNETYQLKKPVSSATFPLVPT